MEKRNRTPNQTQRLPVLVATRKMQGRRTSDFCFVAEGEPVRLGSSCDDESVDGPCGCLRALVGIKSGKATTTFQVAELQMSPGEFASLYRQSLLDAGWTKLLSDQEIHKMIRDDLELAAAFPVGVVLERRGDVIQTRE